MDLYIKIKLRYRKHEGLEDGWSCEVDLPGHPFLVHGKTKAEAFKAARARLWNLGHPSITKLSELRNHRKVKRDLSDR